MASFVLKTISNMISPSTPRRNTDVPPETAPDTTHLGTASETTPIDSNAGAADPPPSGGEGQDEGNEDELLHLTTEVGDATVAAFGKDNATALLHDTTISHHEHSFHDDIDRDGENDRNNHVRSPSPRAMLRRESLSALPDNPNRRGARVALSVPPPMPQSDAQTMMIHRMRSISKVFNILPTKLPRWRDILIDVMEYICHIILLETDVYRQSQYIQDIELAWKAFGEEVHYGRLVTRMHITSMASSILHLRLEDDNRSPTPSSQSTTPSSIESSLDVTSERWEQFLQEWEVLRGYMLRPDANTYVSLETMIEEAEEHHGSDTATSKIIHGKMEQHCMFQADYRVVARLLRNHYVLTKWREDLAILLEHLTDYSTSSIRAMLASSIDALERDWNCLGFWSEPTETVAEVGLPLPIEYLVEPLRPCLLDETDDVSAVIEASSARCKSLLLSNDANEFSHAHLQSMMRSLLIKWSESVLEIPKLFQLGYGGVTAPVPEADVDDDVSSWGGAGEDRKSEHADPTREVPVEVDVDDCKDDDHDDDFLETQPREGYGDDRLKQRFVAQKRVLLKHRTSLTTATAHSSDDEGNLQGKSARDDNDKEMAPLDSQDMKVDPSKTFIMNAADMNKYAEGFETQPTEGQNVPITKDAMDESKGNERRNDEHISLEVEESSQQVPERLKIQNPKTLKRRLEEAAHHESVRARLSPRALRKKELQYQLRARAKAEVLMKPSLTDSKKSSLFYIKNHPSANGEDVLVEETDAELEVAGTLSHPDSESSCDDERTPNRKTSLKAAARQRTRASSSMSHIDAIREGVKKYGVGQWKKMRLNDTRLTQWDENQIKNQYVIMLRNNQL